MEDWKKSSMRLASLSFWLVLCLSGIVYARIVRDYPLEELFEISDVVAIVEPIETIHNERTWNRPHRRPEIFQGLTTRCSVLIVFKGGSNQNKMLSFDHFEL